MPRTLAELKARWFISESTVCIDADPSFHLAQTFADLRLNFRHAGTALENHTDGNLVTILGDGDVYMAKWYDVITSAGITTVYNTNWMLDNVLTKASVPTSTAIDTLIEVNSGPATVYQFVDGNKMASYANIPSNRQLVAGGVISMRDFRFPVNGSNHQKFMVAKTSTTGLALVGSIDINAGRLDDSSHSGNFPSTTHDFGVSVEGPAVADIEKTFVERWNDSSRETKHPFEAIDPLQPPITEPIGTYTPVGSHSVQVLRTYGIGRFSYSWADHELEGEFSIWASTLNAIRKAENYIYIEDQTFLSFAWPALCDAPEVMLFGRLTDLVYQLGEALKRGVRVGIIVSNKPASWNEVFQKHHSLNFLKPIAEASAIAWASNGVPRANFFVGSLDNGNGVIYVHSKMFIVDDEFASVGSANFDQRSMCHDGEIKLGIVDEQNLFVKTLRSTLYQEHSQQPSTAFDDPITAFENMKTFVETNVGRLRNYDFSNLWQPWGHANDVNWVWWPYAGPANLR